MQNVCLRGQWPGLFRGRFHRAGGELDGLLGVAHSELEEGFAFTAQVADFGVFGLGLFKVVGLEGQLRASARPRSRVLMAVEKGRSASVLAFLMSAGFFFSFFLWLRLPCRLWFCLRVGWLKRLHFSEQWLGLCGFKGIDLGYGDKPQVFGAIGSTAAGAQIMGVLQGKNGVPQFVVGK